MRMDYLEAAVVLKNLLIKCNKEFLIKNKGELVNKNEMLVRSNFGKEIGINMDAFTNEFVTKTIKEYESEAFVMTDFVSMMQDGKELNYFLYKGYSRYFDKGLVYFQLVNKETFEAIGELEFSNLEDNIFYSVESPEFEESSCNAIETSENTTKKPCIAFLIGHMNEDRLLFDIQRLIYDTANNVQKHKNRQFKFIIQIDKFGGDASRNFLTQLDKIKQSLTQTFAPTYPNCEFVFAMDNDSQ